MNPDIQKVLEIEKAFKAWRDWCLHNAYALDMRDRVEGERKKLLDRIKEIVNHENINPS